MGLLDDFSKVVSQGIDRAKFEAEKFQRSNRAQSELNDMKRKLDNQMIEIGNRAYELYRAGQISSHSIGELVQAIDDLRSQLVIKEEELKKLQAISYEAATGTGTPPPHAQPPSPSSQPHHPHPASSQPQSIPVQDESAVPQQTVRLPQKKSCPVCKFEMPMHAIFCPNCGYRVGK
jgi:hypothetical protein